MPRGSERSGIVEVTNSSRQFYTINFSVDYIVQLFKIRLLYVLGDGQFDKISKKIKQN